MLYVTGDTHGEIGRFTYMNFEIEKTFEEGDKLFVCGDFGYIFRNDFEERKFLKYLADKPYMILFVDGNHENFDVLNSYPIEKWCGGKVHVIEKDENGNPKIIHLMRGQVYEIDGRRIFTFGGAYSIDKAMRTPGVSWWRDEMPTDEEKKEALANLAKVNNEVDYILTHTAPEDTMSLFHPYHFEEAPLNNFFEYIRENVKYKHWWFGHLHKEQELWRNQTVLWFQIRNMETNEIVEM